MQYNKYTNKNNQQINAFVFFGLKAVHKRWPWGLKREASVEVWHSLQLGEVQSSNFLCLLYSHNKPSPISSVNACDEVKMCI